MKVLRERDLTLQVVDERVKETVAYEWIAAGILFQRLHLL
jgi:hypothetical protein